MSYSLDVKLTIWERIEFESEEQMKDVLSKLKNNELVSSNDVCDYINSSTVLLEDTTEEISIYENDGQPTMEILNEDGDTIWNNVEGDTLIRH